MLTDKSTNWAIDRDLTKRQLSGSIGAFGMTVIGAQSSRQLSPAHDDK